MASGAGGESVREERLHEVIAGFLEAARAGQAPDRQELLARHPDLALELEAFFADHDALRHLARPAQPPAPVPGVTEADAGRTAAFQPAEGVSLAPSEVPSTEQATVAYGAGQSATVPQRDSAPAGPPLGAKVRYVGDYELLAELGRGGMGVVYKARQSKLERVVALKMILAGEHAGAQELARFRTEAQAVARLQHPHIVQVHEVGEYQGHPYFSLEFCPGGSLDRKLDGTPWPAHEAAALVETLARAMQAAHRAGVVHRDLKPANVLLAADGTPKISDFGLAKKLDEAAAQTASGAILGTPSYMAPEQAGGKGKEVGPAADVYALGAILYELVTGRPPFKAATPLDTVFQVVGDEPVPPRQLQSKTPRDLETICLKCLQKEARRRYPSAEALAEDLRRFREGRPILARPVGRLERAAKWVRRNPVLAGMAAVVVLALVGGTAVSTGFGVAARREAELAQKNEADALAKGQQLATANATLTRTAGDLKRSHDELERSRDELETTLARSLLRPLALQGRQQRITEGEWEALWELATTRDGRLGYRFVQEASRAPGTSRQLRDRAALALPAAVGLEEGRRAEVEALLLARLDDPALGDPQRRDLALAAAAWDGLSRPGALPAARQLTRALTEARDPDTLQWLMQSVSAVAARMEAPDAAQAAAALLQALKDTQDRGPLPWLAQGLSAVAARMEPKDAATTLLQALQDTKDSSALPLLAQGLSAVAARMEPRDAAATLLQAMQDTRDPYALQWLAQGLSARAFLEPQDAAQAATLLLRSIKDTRDPYALQTLAEGLSAVAARMGPQDAAATAGRAATLLLQAMNDPRSAYAVPSLALGLSVLATRLGPQEAAATSAQAATLLLQGLKDTKDPNARDSLARGLSAVADRMEARDAAQAAAALLQLIKDAKDPYALQTLAQVLSAVAARMEPQDAAATAAQAATLLLQAMKDTRDTNAIGALAQVLSELASRMEPRDAVTTLVQAVKEARQPNPLSSLARGLSAVAARMGPQDAAQAATILVQALKDTKDPGALGGLVQGLSAVAVRMGPQDAARAATTLLEAMQDTQDPTTFPWLAPGLAALAARMEAREAATTSARAATLLLQAMKDPRNAPTLPLLAGGVSAVAARMAAPDAAQAATLFLQAMKDAKEPNALRWLAEGLAALAARMEPRDAATTLLQAMKDPRNAYALGPLAQGLSGVAARLERQQAATTTAQAATLLLQAMKEPHNSYVLPELVQGLSALDPGLAPQDAAQAATLLLRAMKDPRTAYAVPSLAQSLPALAARMEPKDATTTTAQAVTVLLQIMKDPQNAYALRWQVQGLSALAARMGPLEAAQAATLLLQVMKDTKDPNALYLLAQGLSEVAFRLEARDAALTTAQAVTFLVQDTTPDPAALHSLAQGLSALLSAVPRAEMSTRAATTASAVTCLGGAGQPLPGLALLLRAAEPPPCRLSTQQLVELLKMPSCTGEARHLIIDRLGDRYGRRFADAWGFVRFAREQHLNLDFTTPPQRPERGALAR